MNYTHIHLDWDFVIDRRVATLTEHERHLHDALEISVVVENNVVYALEDETSVLGKPGDVYIFRPFEAHWNLAEHADQPAKWVMLLFAPSLVRHVPMGFRLLAPFYTTGWHPHIVADTEIAKSIRETTFRALAESEAKQPGWETQRWLHMINILLLIYRHYMSERKQDSADQPVVEGIIRTIELMLKSYMKPLDINELISVSGLRKTWFYRQFARMTAVTPNEFINRLRLQHAAHLLRNSEWSVTAIAFDSGFQSLSYFNKMFKKYRGMTPREFRQVMNSEQNYNK